MRTNQSNSNLFKEIFARIWAVWALVIFVITFLIILLPSMASYLFKNYKKGQQYFIFLAKCWMNVWLPLIGCPLKVRGKENFIEGENYIVTFNHNALLDVPLSAPYVPGANSPMYPVQIKPLQNHPLQKFPYLAGTIPEGRYWLIEKVKKAGWKVLKK